MSCVRFGGVTCGGHLSEFFCRLPPACVVQANLHFGPQNDPWQRSKGGRRILKTTLACLYGAISRQTGNMPPAQEHMSALSPADIPSRIGEHFAVVRFLGRGTFGSVVEAVDERTGAAVAIKLEVMDAKFPQLYYEFRVMSELGGNPGFLKPEGFSSQDKFNYLIVKKLPATLESIRVSQRGTLPLLLLGRIGNQILQRLRVLHTAGFAYRDIKPENFMVDQDIVYIIDFGLVKRVQDPHTDAHIPCVYPKAANGTARFMSTRSHNRITQSRRDDLEAFVYMMIFLAHGELPWSGVTGTPEEIEEQIVAFHAATTPETLCAGLPPCFIDTLRYAKGLEFEEVPDFELLFTWWL